MKETFQIKTVTRNDAGKGASRRLRKEGMVPGIIYGGGKDPEMVASNHNDLIQHLDQEAFYSHILEVAVDDGKAQNVVLKDLQRHPSKPFVTHFELLRVVDTDRIKMHVPLHFLGESDGPGLKEGGVISHNMSDIEIICQAKDLPEYIEIDVSAMEIGDMTHLSEITLPEGVEIVVLTHEGGYDAPVVSLHTAHIESEEMDEEEGGEEGAGESESESEGEEG